MKILSLFIPLMLLFPSPAIEIKVAVYFSIGEFAQEVKDAIDYSWTKNGIKYIIKPEIIGKDEIERGNLSKYDILVVPGEGRIYVDALDEKWRENVKKFLANGGGYLGICGGANIAAPSFLGIANISINDDQWEEWQYLWRANWSHGGIPLNVYIPCTNVSIFEGFYGKRRNIRYWGGAGITGDVKPIAIFDEEPSDVAPLHYWIWLGKWIPWKNITTDIKGEYAACVSRYGNGKIVLFSPHPEKDTFIDGHIEEIPARKNLGLWHIYNWIGNRSNLSYNWWILRRSIAWLVDADNPPASETMVYINEPRNGFYIDGRKILDMKETVLIGKCILIANSINITMATIYVDGNKIWEGGNEVNLELFIGKGKHVIKIKGENHIEETQNEISVRVL